ncbi:GGDEF domain-containing protein [Oceanobacillus oncorhynchi subsp. incaldanensis]|uniref:diguanylate cyclase n=1 Tax=Oceanobacillus oncorhynchi TaxID=545501 RepID=UPI001B283FB8|nr:diguanylate cyclase [Oceanobacillus oncorhynchi]GIO18053.1 GGDEF domain-containing protein [Oceanobacillus oncorhynchi subsp. incaldanensis]
MAHGDIMFFFLDDFFINLCVIITLTVLYVPLRSKLKITAMPFWQKGIIDGVLCGLNSVMLIIFSIEVAEGALVDLRFIPIMLMILLEGLFPAVIASIVVIAGRFLIGGMSDFSVSAVFLMIALVIGFQLIHKLYQPHQGKRTYIKAVVMIFYSNIVFTITMMFHFQNDYLSLLSFLPVYCFISFVGGLTSLFFVRYLGKTEMLLAKYKEEVSTDFLTGLQNMRSFEKVWGQVVNKAVIKEEKLTILSLDIDQFKQINDTYGHPAGNQILTQFGDILSRNIRSFDMAFRNGGDEFSIVLPNCSIENALEVAERILEDVKAHPFQISQKESIYITVSIGAATYPDTCSNPLQIIHQADEALYKAKHSGKNQVYPAKTSSPNEL